eukprot:403369526
MSPPVQNLDPTSIAKCQLQKGVNKQYAVAITTKPQFGLYVYSLNDGELLKSYIYIQKNSINSTYYKDLDAVEVLMNSNNIIYIITNYDGETVNIQSIQFDPLSLASDIPSNYYQSYGSSRSKLQAFSTILVTKQDYLYLGVQSSGVLGLLKVDVVDGTSPYLLTINNSSSSSYVTKIDQYELSGVDNYVR